VSEEHKNCTECAFDNRTIDDDPCAKCLLSTTLSIHWTPIGVAQIIKEKKI